MPAVRDFSCFAFISLLLISFFSVLPGEAQEMENISSLNKDKWVDSVYNSLNVSERVAQLIFVRANYSGQDGFIKEVDQYVKDYNIGGIAFFKGEAAAHAGMTNYWNKLAKTPLMITMDAEWGLGMRLNNTVKYPLQMGLGAVQNDSLLYQMGLEVAEQCKRMGIHMNFAPVVDVNSNPLNPVIGMRSFGELPRQVAEKGYYYMKGMQDGGIIACAKHFPGHGNTQSDSHLTLPSVNVKYSELRETELIPFQYLIDQGVGAVMVAHLSVPALERDEKRPTSLSEKAIEKQLIKKMGFGGLVVTDALDMKGVTKYYDKGEVAMEAFKAGNDILLMPDDVAASIHSIVEAIDSGKIGMDRLALSCKKILAAKYTTGAWQASSVETVNLMENLNLERYYKTAQELTAASVTVVKNRERILPLSFPDTIDPAIIIIGTTEITPFEKEISAYFDVRIVRLAHDATVKERQEALQQITKNNLVIIAMLNTNISAAKHFGITDSDVQFIEYVANKKPVVLDVFASPYGLNYFSELSQFQAIVVSYQDHEINQRYSAEVILGMRPANGKLPVSVGPWPAGTGFTIAKTRLTYGNPLELDIDTAILRKVDSIAVSGIEIGAYPGCQILAAKDGVIFYDKQFGYHTYDKLLPVMPTDLYDLASLTKILATTLCLMKLQDEKRIDVDGKISDYLLFLKTTNKEGLGFKEVLSHQSGLQNWIPYFEKTIVADAWDTAIYRPVISEEYPIRVANNMYINEKYHHKILQEIMDSELTEKKYAYSDLGFYLMRVMIEQLTNEDLDDYVYQYFYEPLGLRYLRFHPRRYVALTDIIPTEDDKIFRHQLLLGDVHDQGAAMLGGVSGHAGLFGNSYDVAVVMQMLLNGGTYGNREFIRPETIAEFTSVQFPENENRRGLGFDKPLLTFEDHRSNCRSASPSSFGHAGFTGTYCWADPENGLVYVFLSNRVYPDMHNNKISQLDFRTNIHQLFYDAMGD